MDKQQLTVLSLILLGYAVGMLSALIVNIISSWFVFALALMALSASVVFGHIASKE